MFIAVFTTAIHLTRQIQSTHSYRISSRPILTLTSHLSYCLLIGLFTSVFVRKPCTYFYSPPHVSHIQCNKFTHKKNLRNNSCEFTLCTSVFQLLVHIESDTTTQDCSIDSVFRTEKHSFFATSGHRLHIHFIITSLQVLRFSRRCGMRYWNGEAEER